MGRDGQGGMMTCFGGASRDRAKYSELTIMRIITIIIIIIVAIVIILSAIHDNDSNSNTNGSNDSNDNSHNFHSSFDQSLSKARVLESALPKLRCF